MKSSDQIRPSSRRGASGAWNRLKPVREDPLETYGLPSKGETRLNDYKTQEIYFNRIIERYMKLCALNREQLDNLFATVSSTTKQQNSNNTTNNLSTSLSSLSLHPAQPPQQPTTTPTPASPSAQELSTVLTALRKLREAITASTRFDLFARRAYIFCIHAAILCADWPSYLPALHTLLTEHHARNPLPPPDLKEYVGLLILDQACRQSDVPLARETKLRFRYKDRRVEAVLGALVQDNWVVYWKMRRAVDGYQRAVMGFADQGVRVHALKCLGKGYLGAERRFVERCAERGWEELVQDGVGWELAEGDRVVIRKVRG
ncbi:hypothetical protein P153DRAFT_153953 [Dothidotthia symphoricarpi CBS 119687]|uniref:CSN8/PSMD8/EIF3K domain-containing protein n=1 Tax=Dothidotthia symphoricarpi CBS 119687 TaxID=1392245 RepID=A0A6A6AR29_9PLEO|nr:uncharacterized protein P153DRAFT_153953 [Dothidotthia symphoricarpi CBS 119687]KAF2133297.1 hypothetical protein P153DRAFT_153953 [Dothidotthia symphoricarpi CBS 119687]